MQARLVCGLAGWQGYLWDIAVLIDMTVHAKSRVHKQNKTVTYHKRPPTLPTLFVFNVVFSLAAAGSRCNTIRISKR